MGGYPLNGTVTGGFPVPVGAAIDGEALEAAGRREVALHLGRGGEGRGGV